MIAIPPITIASKEKWRFQFMQIRKLTFAALFIAIGVLSAHLIYIPIGIAKCFPIQHAINILLAVLLGTR